MRSKSMVWLFETLGLTCFLLEGGYKSYRQYVHSELSLPVHLNVIGGRTGSGKTDILHFLEQAGEQVIDLEGLAHHKGSAFGALGESQQPTTEQFENDLYRELSELDRSRKIWIEDESRNVGRCVIPGDFYSRLRDSDIVFLDIPREKRAHHLVKQYAEYDREALKECVLKIEKKLGSDRTRDALEFIDRKDFFNTAMITLHYYDKAYMHSLEKNHKQHIVIQSDHVDTATNAGLLQKHFQK